jgi:hypothetical protein
LNTGIAIPLNFWNIKSRRISDKLPAEFGDYEILNDELNRQKRIAEDLISHAAKKEITNKGAFLKQTFSPTLDITSIVGKVEQAVQQEVKEKKSKLDIYYQFDEYIKSKERKVIKATITIYRNVKSHLEAFENFRKQKIAFNSFDFSFYKDWTAYFE